MPGRPARDRPRGSASAATTRVVVGHLEWPETGRTDVRQADRLGAAAVATAHAGDPEPRCRRTASDSVRWLGQGLDRHGGLPGGGVVASGPGTGSDRSDELRGLRREVPLSRRRSCPDLAPCRLDAGRLSWLQRAGPSATLDKSSSVVCGCYGRAARDVNEPARPPVVRVQAPLLDRIRAATLVTPSRNVVP